MMWVILVIIASAMGGFCNIIDQILRKKYIKDSIVLSVYFGLSSILFLLILPFKRIIVPSIFDLSILLTMGVILLFGLILYVYAISIEEISRVVPLWEISPLLVLLMAFIFLGERLTVYQLLAFFLILMGSFLISIKRIKGLFKISKAFFPMVLSGFIYALDNILIKFMYSKVDFWSVLVWMGLGAVLGALIILSFKKYRIKFIKSLKSLKPRIGGVIFASESLATIARVLYNYALLLSSASLVYVLSGTQNIFVLLYATIFSLFLPKLIKEKIDKKTLLTKTIAILLILAGLYLLYI